MTDLMPCPRCGSPYLTTFKHHADPDCAVQCGDCHFEAATSRDWNHARTPLNHIIGEQK